MTRSIRILTLITLAAVLATPSLTGQELPRVSPKMSLTQTIGLTDVALTYSRPGVKGRTIFGELVPYGRTWRTGANEATSISFSDPVTIDGQPLAAGTYSLHTIPGEHEWTVIFNSAFDPAGFYTYDPNADVLRVTVTPQQLVSRVEWMTLSFPSIASNSAILALDWDHVRVPLRVGVDVHAKALGNIRNAIANAPADDWRPALRGADYAFQHGVAADEASQWIDRSIAISETHANLSLKARMLAAGGDVKGAIATGERAIRVGKASQPPANTANTERLVAEWKAQGTQPRR